MKQHTYRCTTQLDFTLSVIMQRYHLVATHFTYLPSLLLLQESIEGFKSGSQMGPGQPCEVATCYVFLASEDASYISGQTLHPNGGTVING
jgi:NAD(P)-dependent dehydrogenase (short-subunit alcohol dehydrogenase family)